MSRIDDVLAAARVPAYSALSGRGYNGYRQPADFTQHISSLKGYRDQFLPLRLPWAGRLSSLRNLVSGLDAPGSSASLR